MTITYEDAVDAVKDRFADRITIFLTSVSELLRLHGWTGSETPYEMFDDDYSWWITMEHPDVPEALDITIEIAESRGYDGTDAGVNLGLQMVWYGGLICGQCNPYNYTDAVWVDPTNDDAINERFEIILNEGMVAQALDYIRAETGT